ncbi:trypsin-like peptidase domain-containing protein [Amycolatopsis sp. NPDC059657]|uniref:trypsin-like peptidase domain-containing protein n=1 Tax=Amycolatopsis sp. NPDC059657 TaxID=3346899 RepID=UPI0036702B05
MARPSLLSTTDFRKLVLSALFALTALLVTPAYAAAQPNPGQEQVNATAEASTVQLAIKWEGFVNYHTDNGYVWTQKTVVAVASCSGFFVSTTGHLVTAGHCVQPDLGRENILRAFLNQQVKEGQISSATASGLWSDANANWKVEGATQGSPAIRTVYVGQPKGVTGAVITDPLVAQVQDIKPFRDGDTALLKVETPGATPAMPVAAADPKTGSAVTSIGFPASVGDSVAPGNVRASFKTGTVSSQQITDTGVAVTEINADISEGMSGGPTVDAQGNALGVNSYKLNGEQQNFNFVTDTSDLKAWLTGRSVALLPEKAAQNANPAVGQSAPVSPPAPESSGIPVYVWIIAAAVLLLAAIAVVILLLRRKRPAPPQQFTTPYTAPNGYGPACQSCGVPGVPGASFCGNCGTPLAPQQQHL